jgi:hypothetical protein
MEEHKCLLIKYCFELSDGNELDIRFVLNEFYSSKFKMRPVNQIEIIYTTCLGYGNDFGMAKLYFVEPISIQTYNEIKRLSLAHDENHEYIVDELNK